MNKTDFTYCPYCNGRGHVKIEKRKKFSIYIERKKCFACDGTGKRRKDYGGYNQCV